jgi:hypothetical protein
MTLRSFTGFVHPWYRARASKDERTRRAYASGLYHMLTCEGDVTSYLTGHSATFTRGTFHLIDMSFAASLWPLYPIGLDHAETLRAKKGDIVKTEVSSDVEQTYQDCESYWGYRLRNFIRPNSGTKLVTLHTFTYIRIFRYVYTYAMSRGAWETLCR